MQVSREYALKELVALRDAMTAWAEELDNPAAMSADGEIQPFYEDGVPGGLSVNDVEGFPALQFRAELVAMSGRLEALAST